MNDNQSGNPTRRSVLHGAGAMAAGGLAALNVTNAQAATDPGCSAWTQPSDADFAATIGKDKAEFIDRVLTVVEKEIVPKTYEGVRGGSKLFGGAVLKKADLSTVVASTNKEAGNPLLHGEIQTINAFYDLPKDERPPVGDTIFLTTHCRHPMLRLQPYSAAFRGLSTTRAG